MRTTVRLVWYEEAWKKFPKALTSCGDKNEATLVDMMVRHLEDSRGTDKSFHRPDLPVELPDEFFTFQRFLKELAFMAPAISRCSDRRRRVARLAILMNTLTRMEDKIAGQLTGLASPSPADERRRLERQRRDVRELRSFFVGTVMAEGKMNKRFLRHCPREHEFRTKVMLTEINRVQLRHNYAPTWHTSEDFTLPNPHVQRNEGAEQLAPGEPVCDPIPSRREPEPEPWRQNQSLTISLTTRRVQEPPVLVKEENEDYFEASEPEPVPASLAICSRLNGEEPLLLDPLRVEVAEPAKESTPVRKKDDVVLTVSRRKRRKVDLGSSFEAEPGLPNGTECPSISPPQVSVEEEFRFWDCGTKVYFHAKTMMRPNIFGKAAGEELRGDFRPCTSPGGGGGGGVEVEEETVTLASEWAKNHGALQKVLTETFARNGVPVGNLLNRTSYILLSAPASVVEAVQTTTQFWNGFKVLFVPNDGCGVVLDPVARRKRYVSELRSALEKARSLSSRWNLDCALIMFDSDDISAKVDDDVADGPCRPPGDEVASYARLTLGKVAEDLECPVLFLGLLDSVSVARGEDSGKEVARRGYAEFVQVFHAAFYSAEKTADRCPGRVHFVNCGFLSAAALKEVRHAFFEGDGRPNEMFLRHVSHAASVATTALVTGFLDDWRANERRAVLRAGQLMSTAALWSNSVEEDAELDKLIGVKFGGGKR